MARRDLVTILGLIAISLVLAAYARDRQQPAAVRYESVRVGQTLPVRMD